jgi:signal transduction histidine kinase
MIDTISVLFLNGYAYIKKHPQLLLTLLLIIVIPTAFLISGQQFLNAARDNQEKLERERVGMLQDIFSSFLLTGASIEQIQSEIERIVRLNPDIVEFSIAREHNGNLLITASSNKDAVGAVVAEPESYRLANVAPGESVIQPRIKNGTRYWESYRLLHVSGESAYVFVNFSLAYIDSLFAARIVTAYIWLFAILGIVLVLVIRHVRLIDYAYLYRETKRANEMKDLFTNMIAHELRAPLTAMRGYASLIRESNTDDETRNYATYIENSAERLVAIVNDLLDVARIHSGKLSIKKENTNVKDTVASVIETLTSSAKEKGVSLKEENIPPVSLLIDPKRLHQALTNLVSNSIKYTKAGNISIALEERNDRIEIRVKDTGMGISAENQKKLFAPFFRIENNQTIDTVGTGLGMWITKQLIELMEGSIAVESIRGVGTHIVVTLPKQKPKLV